MKSSLKALSGVAAAVAMLAASAPSYASTVAVADMNIISLGLVDAQGVPINPNQLTILFEQRQGAAASNFNGVAGTGAGAGNASSAVTGATVDVANRCAGDCGAGTLALYGGNFENNFTTHLGVPGTRNFALGDMYISGAALGGAIDGLTRANAMTGGPNNAGGSSATIINSASIQGAFTTGATFTGSVLVAADWAIRAYVDSILPTTGLSTAGFGWIMQITGPDIAALTFNPSDLNQTFFSTSLAQNQANSDNNSVGGIGQAYTSALRTFTSGVTYNFAINQSSNATVSEIPEPASLALVGLGLLAMSALRKRKSA